MMNRIATVWLPSLVSLTAAMGLLMILRRLGLHPYVMWVGRMPMLLYVPWLLLLPLSSATGAYLSRRGGGSRLACFIAGLFPGIVLVGLVCSGLAGMAIRNQLDRPEWFYIVITLVNWVILPAGVLLVGILPFLRPQGKVWHGPERDEDPQNHHDERIQSPDAQI